MGPGSYGAPAFALPCIVGNLSGGEEVRDGPHNHNRGGGSGGGVAPATVPLLMPRAGALRGPGPYNAARIGLSSGYYPMI